MSDEIFQTSDLATRRTDVVKAARAGVARVRDKDGTSLVMLPEGELDALQELADWSAAHLRLEALLRRETRPTVAELGDLAWLRVFDDDDLAEFMAELQDVLIAAHADKSAAALHTCIHAWRVTARQLEDPLRREVLLRGKLEAGDLVGASRPADTVTAGSADAS
ncbi:DUF6247 family protein [Actinocrispum wychmicini]|uniref:Prevent-host-death family protein n=1 Tax=Actinocrispum wychmicini TaxID=1213861 RepID=A0A4R2JY70_9PSEU|nr:DUF6247 family protein [Actinocrispum wychmicini]TCO64247.1 hypothetical protein EV192_10111 [Actinocrispum wychmicini]